MSLYSMFTNHTQPQPPVGGRIRQLGQFGHLRGVFPAPIESSGKKVNWKVSILAGGISGAIEICITFPTEFVKTLLQLDSRSVSPRYRGSMDCVRDTIRTQGFFGMYRGLSILLLGSVPKVASRFWAFEEARGLLMDKEGKLSTFRNFGCGLLAGMTEAVVAVCPMETIKVRLIEDSKRDKPQFRGLFHGVSSIVRAEGITGIYKGITATVLKQGSNQAIRFFVFEEYKKFLIGNRQDAKLSTVQSLAGGVLAGAVSVAGNNPFDVIKTKMQGLDAKQYRGVIHCFTQTLKNDGAYAFYRGSFPRLLRVCADTAIVFTLYEKIKTQLQKFSFLN